MKNNISPLGTEKQLVIDDVNYIIHSSLIYLQVTPALKGHVLAEDVFAPHNVPATATTSVDGYAVRCKLLIVSDCVSLTWSNIQQPTQQESTRC